ncbi:hypothetical protein NBRC116583_04850 [Arenicella sp. 4NH20-0111]|uniref:phosphotransferase n=1 Tax=Arenicella sp. 4NH20-0111 TaxID=3127648 RepID=UPI0031053D59
MPSTHSRKRLNFFLTQWADWGLQSEPRLISVFTAGKNHLTALLSHNNDKLVLKIFDHSFEQAVIAQTRASKLGIAPKVLFSQKPVALMEYVNTEQPSLESTAQALTLLHSIPITDQKPFDLKGFYASYLENAPRSIKAWHEQLTGLVDEFLTHPISVCFCHNDLVNENCLGSNDQAIIIDWEFAQANNPWFDLAAIILYRDLSLDEAKAFLSAYSNDWSDQTSERIFLSSQLTLLWGDLLWHLHKYGNDYAQQNTARFDKVDELATQLGVSLQPA